MRPPIPGAELGIISDDAFYLKRMPKRVAIVGSGYIAVEFAGIFADLGAQVDLVYRQPLPLRGFDIDLREALAEALGAQGITLHPRLCAAETRGGWRWPRADVRRRASLHADLVFFATGRAPATRVSGWRRPAWRPTMRARCRSISICAPTGTTSTRSAT